MPRRKNGRKKKGKSLKKIKKRTVKKEVAQKLQKLEENIVFIPQFPFDHKPQFDLGKSLFAKNG